MVTGRFVLGSLSFQIGNLNHTKKVKVTFPWGFHITLRPTLVVCSKIERGDRSDWTNDLHRLMEPGDNKS